MITLPIVPRARKWHAFFIAATLFGVCYMGAGAFGLPNAAPLNPTVVDRAIPFLSWTIWIYMSQYIFVPLSYVVVTRPRNYTPMLYSVVFTTLLSTLIFLLYPTLIHREPFMEQGLGESARALLYAIDMPTNCFPSLHVALAALAPVYIYREHKTLGAISSVWALLIILSTLTLKQHYFVDVLGGFGLAFLSYTLVNKRVEKTNESSANS